MKSQFLNFVDSLKTQKSKDFTKNLWLHFLGRGQLSQDCRTTTKRKFTYNHKSPGILRSSHQRYPVRKDVFRKFANFTGKPLCQRWLTHLIDHGRMKHCVYVSANYFFWSQAPWIGCLDSEQLDHCKYWQ